MKLNTQNLKQVLQTVLYTEEKEFNCDDCFQQIEQFVELKISGKTPAEAMPLVDNHLKVCNSCREEYEVLRTALQHLDKS